MSFYLRIGEDTLEEVRGYRTKSGAVEKYRAVAQSLERFGQRIDGAIHIAPSREQVVEYPDFVLSLGPRGGVKVEST